MDWWFSSSNESGWMNDENKVETKPGQLLAVTQTPPNTSAPGETPTLTPVIILDDTQNQSHPHPRRHPDPEARDNSPQIDIPSPTQYDLSIPSRDDVRPLTAFSAFSVGLFFFGHLFGHLFVSIFIPFPSALLIGRPTPAQTPDLQSPPRPNPRSPNPHDLAGHGEDSAFFIFFETREAVVGGGADAYA
jgi:hypothetical protein